MRTAYHGVQAVCIGEKAFGLRTFFLTAREAEGSLVGVLPLVEQSSWLFGRYLVSVPYFTYGGVLADSAVVARALSERAGMLGKERVASHVELRHDRSVEAIEFPERLDKVSMILELPGSDEELAKSLGAKLRSQIRRADREDPVVITGGRELLPEFYTVFASCMHELGTPVYSRKFFDCVYEAMSDVLTVFVVRVAGKVQAAAITVRHADRTEVPWAAATLAAKRSAINMRLYWEMLKASIEAGAKAFDFGRCTVESGTYRFKAQWGAKPRQLHWHYWLPEYAAIPQLNHSNPKYAMAVKLWRKMPLWCANIVGPPIAKNLP